MTWPRTLTLAVAVGVLTLTAPAATAKGPSTSLRTLVSSPRPIYAFAQDGDAIGWIASDARVRVRSLTKGKTWLVGRVDPAERAHGASLALAGSRALWAWDNGGNDYETGFASGAQGRAQNRFPGLIGGARNFGDGERFAGIAGDDATLAFGWADETCAGVPFGVCDFCNPLGSCPLVVNGGGVATVPAQAVRRRPPAIPNVPPPALLTVGSRHVAVVAARSPTPEGEWVPRVGEDAPVDVFDLGGRLVTHIPLIGTVRSLALTPNALDVLLERPDGSKTIVRYGLRTSIFLGGSTLLPLGATSLSASASGIVFRDGPRIYQLHGPRPTLVAVANAAPIGLSIEGKRIAWAENVHGRGRIRAVAVG